AFDLVHVFFFSSRRRHTRWPRDWSSDVCSSDLVLALGARRAAHRASPRGPRGIGGGAHDRNGRVLIPAAARRRAWRSAARGHEPDRKRVVEGKGGEGRGWG